VARAIRIALGVALTGLACVPVGALAADDQAATRAYIGADFRLIHAATSKLHRGEATLRGILARVSRECPMVAARAPHDSHATELENEVIGAMATALIALDRPAGNAFVSATRRLRWSDPKLTRSVHRYVEDVRTLLALPQPNVCADFESWAASGFTTLSAATLTFTPRFLHAWVVVGNLPPGLTRSETSAERPLIARTRRLEQEFADFEAREVETYGDVIRVLGLRL
jgi:hypothetical protein